MPRHVAVVGQDGSDIGTTETVLGDFEEDIFHGIAMKRKHDGRVVEVPAARVKRITERHVITDLTEADAEALPPPRTG